jgi:hypothetical protein
MGETVKDMLVRQGIEAGRAGTRKRHGKIARTAGTGAAGIGAGDQSGGTDRLLTGLREGGDRNPMGMGKTGAAKAPASRQEVGEVNRPGGRVGIALRVHTNPNVPTSTRQAARKSTASLVVVK